MKPWRRCAIWNRSVSSASRPCVISKRKPYLPTYTAEAIRRLREHLHLVSPYLRPTSSQRFNPLRNGKTAKKKPSGAALRLLSVIERRGLEVLV